MRQISERRLFIPLQKKLLKNNRQKFKNLAPHTFGRFYQCVRKTAGQARGHIVAGVNGNDNDNNNEKLYTTLGNLG